jgi:hypothetical protein
MRNDFLFLPSRLLVKRSPCDRPADIGISYENQAACFVAAGNTTTGNPLEKERGGGGIYL